MILTEVFEWRYFRLNTKGLMRYQALSTFVVIVLRVQLKAYKIVWVKL